VLPVHGTKAYWGDEILEHSCLLSALDGGERSASRFRRFTRGGKFAGTC